MKVILNVACIGTPDAPPILQLFAGTARILLGSFGEGCQRTLMEKKIKFTSSTDALLISRISWENSVGGLPGMLLTMADSGSNKIKIIGPESLDYFLYCIRPFYQRSAFSLELCSPTSSSIIACGEVQSEFIISTQLMSKDHESSSKTKLYKRSRESQKGDRVLTELFEDTSSKNHVVSSKKTATVSNMYPLMFYIKLPTHKGKFNINSARALGIPPGKTYGELSQGRCVEFNGRTIFPHEVIESDEDAGYILSLEYLDMNEFRNLILGHNAKMNELGKIRIRLVIHTCPFSSYLKEGEILNFVRKDTSIKHLFLFTQLSHEITFKRFFNLQTELSKAYPENFMLPNYFMPNFKDFSCVDENIIIASSGMQIVLDRNGRFDVTSSNELQDSIQNDNRYNFSAKIISQNSLIATCLGTAAAIPTIYRNVSCTHVYIPGYGCVLFDCGEGSYGQFKRLNYNLEDLRCICISHIHADHHLGLFRFLLAKHDDSPLIVVAPKRIFQWLDEYFVLENIALSKSIKLVSAENIEGFDRISIKSIGVIHCPSSFGYVLCFNSYRIAYSGDTRPCQELITAAGTVFDQCDLFIHEATFINEDLNEAVEKYHTTVTEAILSCAPVSKFVLLNHFSSRYGCGFEILNAIGNNENDRIIVGFDLMKVEIENTQVLSPLPSSSPSSSCIDYARLALILEQFK